ncbi:hypothetical protein [Gimesia sp.]|uniref:hypothetical protein n=1 Tax=Gimesia sp. TaxID=2024833 RepID=UPI003A8DAC25
MNDKDKNERKATVHDFLDFMEEKPVDAELRSQIRAALAAGYAFRKDDQQGAEQTVRRSQSPVNPQGFFNFQRIQTPPPVMIGNDRVNSGQTAEVEKILDDKQYGFTEKGNYLSCQLEWGENERKLNAPYYFLLIQALDPRSGKSLGQALLPVRPDKVAKNRVVGTLATTELAETLGITREQLLDDKQCAIYLKPLGPENIEELDSSLIETLQARLKKNPQSPYLEGVRLLLADWDDDL